MRVITPASRDVVIRRRQEAENCVQRAMHQLDYGHVEDARAELRHALDALREIEVEIDPA